MHSNPINPKCVGLLLAALLAWGTAGCSGGSTGVCGNGINEANEECDCGSDPNNLPPNCYRINGGENSSCSLSCELRQVMFTKIILRWTINGESFLIPGQSFDTCNDVSAARMNVRLESASGYLAEEPDVFCTNHQVEFMDEPNAEPLLPGAYTAFLELQNADATPLGPFQVVHLDVIEGVDNEVTVDFPLDEFFDVENMRGEFGVRAYWGGDEVGCAEALTEVVDRSFVVSQDGSALAGFPDDGACLDQTSFFGDLIPGDYELRVEGFDATAGLQYCGVWDIKVGIGIQPAYYFTVPTYDASAGCSL